MKALGPRVLGAFEGRVLNIHPSLLPRHGGRGMYGDRVHAAVLASGDAESGATVHLVTAGIDEGPVLAEMHDRFIPDNGLRMSGRHHEIYFSDFRRVAPEKLRTLLRQPVESTIVP